MQVFKITTLLLIEGNIKSRALKGPELSKGGPGAYPPLKIKKKNNHKMVHFELNMT